MDHDSDPPPPPLSPIQLLPEDALHHIFSRLPLRQAVALRLVCRLFRDALAAPPFLSLLPSLPLLALRQPRQSPHSPAPPTSHLLAFDPSLSQWLRLPLSFLPFPSAAPVTASPSLLYLWADPVTVPNPSDPNDRRRIHRQAKLLVLCNPLTRTYRVLPQLGSAWSRHGTVLAGPTGMVLVLTELAALSYSPGAATWLKFSLNLPSKPRSPLLIGSEIYALCDVGSPWRSQWKLFSCPIRGLAGPRGWAQMDRPEWGDVFDILKRPRLVRGSRGRILMIGGLRSSFAVDAPCSTVLILRLDLTAMEWDEAGRMPLEMYKCFATVATAGGGNGGAGAAGGGNNKVKVFGGEGRVWFSGKRVRGKMAMWEEEEEVVVEEEGKGEEGEEKVGKGGKWRWVEGVPGHNDGVYRGFAFDAGLTEIP